MINTTSGIALLLQIALATSIAVPLQAQPAASMTAVPTALSPCRLFERNVAVAGPDISPGERLLDIRSTECSSLIPANATALVLRINGDSGQATRAQGNDGVVTFEVQPGMGRSLVLPISPATMAVDLVGYLTRVKELPVPAKPVQPVLAGAKRNMISDSRRLASESISGNLTGPGGDVIMDASDPVYYATGILLKGKAAYPHIVAVTPTSDPWSDFQIFNSSSTSLLKVAGDGTVQLSPAGFLSGRTSYIPTTYASVPGNVIHSVSLFDPRDAAGGATQRIVLFRAMTPDEFTSPVSTKYEAYTNGYYGQPTGPASINFDSQVHYSSGAIYHYRAVDMTTPSAPVDTFSVRSSLVGGSPRADMVVSGMTTLGTAGDPNPRLTVNGNINVTGNINAKYQDVAEWVPTSEKLVPGTVVILSAERTSEVTKSLRAYDTTVAGVVSEHPGLSLGIAGDAKIQIATTGRVKVHVDASKNPIRIGDLLVTSDKPGTAMRSEPMEINGNKFHRPGTLVGKAIEPLASGEGDILVLLSLQ
jgi:hypothetical protein